MKRKFKVTISYDVELDDPDTESGSVTGLHIMGAVYACQVGNNRGMTDTEPALAYDAEEIDMTWQAVD